MNIRSFRACQYGFYNRVSQIIESDPNAVNLQDSDGITPLHWAALNDHIEVCQLLVNKGAPINAVGGSLKATPLHWAIREGKLRAVIRLLSLNADRTILEGEGRLRFEQNSKRNVFFFHFPVYNCIHVATMCAQTAIVAYLAGIGEDVNGIDKMGMTPLMHAAVQTRKFDQFSLAQG